MATRFRIAAALAAILLASTASHVDAGWGWFGGSWGGSYGGCWGGSYGGSYGGGSWGSYGSYGGGSWGGCWGSYGSYGGGSWGGRWGSYGSYGGSCWGSYGGYSYSGYSSYGGCYGSYGYSNSYVTYSQPAAYTTASCGSVGSTYSSYATPVVQSTTAYSPVVTDDCCGGTSTSVESSYDGAITAPVEMPYSVPSENIQSAPATMPEGQENASDKTALLSVTVPNDAVVYVNGYRTKSTGELRRFLSTGLNRGDQYAYEIRAVVDRDGHLAAATRKVTLGAGGRATVAFSDADLVSESQLTTLTLHVPEDAQVSLAGVETNMTGSTRVFKTDRLASGKSWKDYTVRVTVIRDGKEITREKTTDIRAGENREMSFLVDEDMLAAR